MRHPTFRPFRSVLTLVMACSVAGAASAQVSTGAWVTIDYDALVDRRELTHSGESVGVVLDRLGGRPVPPAGERVSDRLDHALLDPLLELYAFVLIDALDSLSAVADPPLIEIGGLWYPGQRQPAWVELLRARRLLVESDGRGRLRALLPLSDDAAVRQSSSGDAAQTAFTAAWPVLRHVLAAEQRRLASLGSEPVKLRVEVHGYLHAPARTRFTLGVEPYRVEVEDTRGDGRRPPLDLPALQRFLDSGLQLEGARLEENGELRLFGSPSRVKPTLNGRPLELSDFAVAYRTVFHGGLSEPYMSLDRGFSPQTSVVNYGGRLRDTALGAVSLLCDIRFKTFSLGLDIVRGEDVRPRVRGEVPEFRTHLERFAADPRSQQVSGQQTRLWFYPDNVDLTVSAQSDVLAMRRVRMSAASERVLDQTMTAVAGDDPPWTGETVGAINRDYEAFAEEFPELAELDQVVRLLSLFTWLRQARAVGLAVPDLDVLLAVELPPVYTPRTFPQLLAFNALPPAGGAGAVVVYDRVPVADALDRLGARGGRPLPARLRFQRAAAALDPDNAQESALLDEFAGYDPAGLDPSSLDLLAYRAERLRMHRLVLSTLGRERTAPLAARQQAGERLRIFSVGIGGLDLGMDRALARARGQTLQFGAGSLRAGSAAASTPTRATDEQGQPPAEARPRDAWRQDPPTLPPVRLPDHGSDPAAPDGSARNRIETGVDETSSAEGTVTRSAWIWTLLDADGPEVRSRKIFLDDGQRAVRVERFERSRPLRYHFERRGEVLAAVRESAGAGPESEAGAPALPEGVVSVQVFGSAPRDTPTLRVRLEFNQAGAGRQLEADFPRPVLQRLVMGRSVDLTPTQPMPLAPLPDTLGQVRVVMLRLGAGLRARPWEAAWRSVPGEADPVRLARAINRWSRQGPTEPASAPAVVATAPGRSVGRWSAAPVPGNSATLVLPTEGFAGPSQALRARLAAAWSAGPVTENLPAEIDTRVVVMVSDEPPSGCASRLRRIAADPAMGGKLLAGWCLAGDLRPDIPAALLDASGLAGLGVATSSIVDLRRSVDELAAFAAALSSPLNADRRIEQIDGPFLWFF